MLVTTAIAEATGHVDESVTAALHNSTWTERWADALYSATGELASSVERMTYTRDERLERVKRQSGVVHQRMGRVNTLLRTRRREQGWDMLPPHLKGAQPMALAILAKHYREEVDQLTAQEITRRGLATHPPLYGMGYNDVIDAIEDAVRQGLIDSPGSPEVDTLQAVPLHELTSVVAKDVKDQHDRCAGLRHPMLLRRWSSTLEHLRDQHCELAGIPADFTVSLPSLDMRELRAMADDDAWGVINRRRFVRALAQRWRECQMHVRQLGRIVAQRSDELRRPWYEARQAARERLGQCHPEELEALIRGFAPFCEPGSTQIRPDGLSGRARAQAVRELKEALAAGRLRALLDAPTTTEGDAL